MIIKNYKPIMFLLSIVIDKKEGLAWSPLGGIKMRWMKMLNKHLNLYYKQIIFSLSSILNKKRGHIAFRECPLFYKFIANSRMV